MPTKGGATVYVCDLNGSAADAIEKAARRYGSKVDIQIGKAKFFGDTEEFSGTAAGQGTEREQSDRARGVYETVIRESSISDSQRIWADIRDRWSPPQVVEGGYPEFDPGQDRDQIFARLSFLLARAEHRSVDLGQGGPSLCAFRSIMRLLLLLQEVEMRPLTVLIAAFLCMIGSPAMAQLAALQVPQSIRLQHEQIIGRLDHLAKRSDEESADAARKALTFLKEHYAKEEAFVLPPLGLLPRIVKGDITNDMEPAIAMADRTKAALPDLEKDHVQITSLMNELVAVGTKKRNDELVRLATRVAAQSLNDIEVAQPTTILIGDYLRQYFSSRAGR